MEPAHHPLHILRVQIRTQGRITGERNTHDRGQPALPPVLPGFFREMARFSGLIGEDGLIKRLQFR